MRFDLKIEDLSGFLDKAVVATLATYGADGTVRLSPVWFEWLNDGFNVVIPDGDVKARHLKRDSRASLVVYENEHRITLRTKTQKGILIASEIRERP